MSEITLRECPLCGGEAVPVYCENGSRYRSNVLYLSKRGTIRCKRCGLELPRVYSRMSKAVEVWNRRHGYTLPARSGKTLVLQLEKELAGLRQERDAAIHDLASLEDACEVCMHGGLYKNDCKVLFEDGRCDFKWRGVCRENVKVNKNG